MKMKNRLKRLQVRIKDYEATIKRVGAENSKAFRKPGSTRK